MRSLLLVGLLFGVNAATPQVLHNTLSPHIPPPAFAPQTLGGDTLLASPWLQERTMRVWTKEKRAAYCITSFAMWPRFYFLRHMTTAKGPECPGETPLFVQGQCPEEVRPKSKPAFVVVQCGPNVFRLYHRNRPVSQHVE